MDSQNEWAHFYASTTAAERTVVSTAPGPVPPVLAIPEGRVGKSARRRTRASRRAPTTLLNTDPTNFRAMVQQFTGAPASPYASPGGPIISFGFGDRIHHHHHHQPQQQQQQQPTVGSLGNYGQYHGQGYEGAVMLPGGNASDGFVQTSSSTTTTTTTGTSTGGFFFEGMMGAHDNRSGGYLL